MERHPSVPWVLVGPSASGGYYVACTVCNESLTAGYAEAVQQFVSDHANHESPSPTHLGLGDVVRRVTDAAGFQHCGGCEKRQHELNQLLPSFWRR